MIKLEDYELIAECIRSDQIEFCDVVRILHENPKFKDWYIKKYRRKDEQKNRWTFYSE